MVSRWNARTHTKLNSLLSGYSFRLDYLCIIKQPMSIPINRLYRNVLLLLLRLIVVVAAAAAAAAAAVAVAAAAAAAAAVAAAVAAAAASPVWLEPETPLSLEINTLACSVITCWRG